MRLVRLVRCGHVQTAIPESQSDSHLLGVARESGTVHPRSLISILTCIAQAPKGVLHASPKRPSAQVGRDLLPWERGNRELSAKPRRLSIPPLYPVHVYRLAETYTADQLLAKRVSSKN